jgi:hypothetical protein
MSKQEQYVKTARLNEVMPDTKQSQSSSIIDLTKTGKYGRYVVPISSEADAEIHRLRSGGMPTTGISNALAKKGILISWQRVRSVLATTARLTAKAERTKTAENVAPAHPEEPTSQSPPGVEGTQGIAREASGPTRGTPEEKPPTPKSISRAELDAKIWEMYIKEKLTEEAISDRLYAEGLFYSEKSVHIRLISQGAAI